MKARNRPADAQQPTKAAKRAKRAKHSKRRSTSDTANAADPARASTSAHASKPAKPAKPAKSAKAGKAVSRIPRRLRGYRRAQVDAVLAGIAGTLGTAELTGPPVTAEQTRAARFGLELRGYDRRIVDELLSERIRELEAYEQVAAYGEREVDRFLDQLASALDGLSKG